MAVFEDDPFTSPRGWGEDARETTFAQGRSPEYTYVSRSFSIDRPASSDFGQPARFVQKVFDSDVESRVELEGNEWVIYESPGGRVQVKLLLTREAGHVKELWLQKVPANGAGGNVKVLLNLKSDSVQRLIDTLKAIDQLPIVGGATQRIDDSIIRQVFDDPDALGNAYRRNTDRFRDLITSDKSASDVIALAHRREQVAQFHRYLEDDAYFEVAVEMVADKKAETVWQRFFEANAWILGMSLSGQLLTSWDDEKLEQVVAGRSVASVGKRADALLQTSGRIRSMVFAEFKTHKTPLLGTDYRTGCWAPSTHLSGGVAQAQGTVHRAALTIGERLAKVDDEGAERLGEWAYLLRPKSYLLIGQLGEFVGDAGGHHIDKVRSFELYRRHLSEPEVITFDELLARADWLVAGTSEAFADDPWA
jgi:hypothetical protein